MLNKNKKF